MSRQVEHDSLPALAAAGAEAYFRHQKLNCATAVLLSLNEIFAGELNRKQCRDLTAGMAEGLDAGCICGALNGAVMAIGLILGHGRRSAKAAKLMHDRFRQAQGATCCRVIRKKDACPDAKAQFNACAIRTAGAAAEACRIILEYKPGLAVKAAPARPGHPLLLKLRRFF